MALINCPLDTMLWRQRVGHKREVKLDSNPEPAQGGARGHFVVCNVSPKVETKDLAQLLREFSTHFEMARIDDGGKFYVTVESMTVALEIQSSLEGVLLGHHPIFFDILEPGEALITNISRLVLVEKDLRDFMTECNFRVSVKMLSSQTAKVALLNSAQPEELKLCFDGVFLKDRPIFVHVITMAGDWSSESVPKRLDQDVPQMRPRPVHTTEMRARRSHYDQEDKSKDDLDLELDAYMARRKK